MIEIVADKESKVNKKNTISIYNKSLRQCFIDDYHKALDIRGYDNLNAKGRNLLSWPVLECHIDWESLNEEKVKRMKTFEKDLEYIKSKDSTIYQKTLNRLKLNI
jgi:hypothetical protein